MHTHACAHADVRIRLSENQISREWFVVMTLCYEEDTHICMKLLFVSISLCYALRIFAAICKTRKLWKPRDAAAFLFGLKFTDSMHDKFKSSQASELQTYRRKT